MRVLIACEFSGRVRDAFAKLGHDAISCDLRPSLTEGKHVQGNVIDLLKQDNAFDLMIAHPPCTYLALSGLWRNQYEPDREAETENALDFVRFLMNQPISKIAIENPRSCISTRIRPKDQTIQPYEFGEDASKETWLWLKNLPRLKPTKYIEPRITDKGFKRWSNQLDDGNAKLINFRTRAQVRSITYQGIADAMAQQWGTL